MRCKNALLTLLGHVDYTSKYCKATEMVGAVLPKEIIDLARDAIKEESKQDVAPDIKSKIFVVTENGKLNVYKGPSIITGIEAIEIMLSTEEKVSEPKVLLLIFNDGKKMDYLQSEVMFDIHTNGGYLIKGKQPNVTISLGGCDCRDPGAIPDARLLLTRIQKLHLVADTKTYPFIHTNIEIIDTYHEKIGTDSCA